LLPRPARSDAAAAPDDPSLSGQNAPPRPAALMLRLSAGKTGALLVRVRNADEAKTAVALARRLGFTQLWCFGAGMEESGGSALAAAVAAGRDARPPLPVFAVVSLLKRDGNDHANDHAAEKAPTPPGEAAAARADDDRDRNLLGETSAELARRRSASPFGRTNGYAQGALNYLLDPPGDFLRFDTPALAQTRAKQVRDLAATPGLAGLVLRHTVAPGYSVFGDDDWYYGLGEAGDFGYTLPLRLAFLRQEGYDP
jgi:hypothetical protein